MKAVSSISKWLFYLALLPAVLFMGAWQGWEWWSWAQSPVISPSSKAGEDKAVQIQIPPGTAAQKIGKDLEAAGVIRSYQAWKLWTYWLRFQDKQGGFKAGTYKLSPTQPLTAIADKIWAGEVMEVSFTIPEGWSLQQMATYFESLGYFKAQDFLNAASQIPKDKYPWLPDNLPHLEGFLYPDTYQLPSDRMSAPQVIQQMLSRFEQVALPLYQQGRNQTKLSLFQWVTLASIVEKEAVIATERPRIAGVFTSRLQKGMRLETDPTVEYGLGIRQTMEQPLTFAQVKTPSPYNTYLNPGLPPTPIASPGVASLKAALYPEKTDFLFFVARYDGSHVFSKTLAEHQSATSAIRQQINSQQKPAS
jgi:UPF0755 protein